MVLRPRAYPARSSGRARSNAVVVRTAVSRARIASSKIAPKRGQPATDCRESAHRFPQLDQANRSRVRLAIRVPGRFVTGAVADRSDHISDRGVDDFDRNRQVWNQRRAAAQITATALERMSQHRHTAHIEDGVDGPLRVLPGRDVVLDAQRQDMDVVASVPGGHLAPGVDSQGQLPTTAVIAQFNPPATSS